MKKTNLLLLCGLFSTFLFAQNQAKNWCYTDQNTELLHQQNPSLIQQRQEVEDYIAAFKETNDPLAKKATIIIPVVVHNITHNNGQGYVSKATIEAQIDRLNTDFNRLNLDTSSTRPLFKPYAASIDVEFRLARLDPNGQCTEGIVRKESPLSFNGGDAVKAVSYWDSKKYFNIWVVDAIEQNPDGSYVAGYAQFPGDGINATYGVVCVNQNFGGSSRTLTHELGHCLNLLHTFNYGYCGGGGDNCSDTPPVYESSFDCDPNRNTCSNDGTFYGGDVVDQFENYMSYASCQNMFTLQQKTRVLATLNSTSTTTGLKQLWNPTNLADVGVNDPYITDPICIPVDANFTYNKQYICEGDEIDYADIDTYNATPTLWDWTFEGGTPQTSNLESPSVVYNTEGVYDVTYSPGTSAGWATPKVKTDLITVSSLAAQYIIPFIEGFENTTTISNDWRIETESGNGWEATNQTSYTGNNSFKIDNVSNSSGDITEAISPSYDFTSINNPTLSYKWAYAQKTSGGNDLFIISYSLDCGGSWTPLAFKAGSSMTTAPAANSAFEPSMTSEWDSEEEDLSVIANEPNVRFKFHFKSGEGNNFYLDDINLDFQVGIEEEKVLNNLAIYPNPMVGNTTLSFSLNKNIESLSVKIKDVLGKDVTSVIKSKKFSAGKYTLSIDKNNQLSSGMYFIEFNADNDIRIEKLIVK